MKKGSIKGTVSRFKHMSKNSMINTERQVTDRRIVSSECCMQIWYQ